MNAIKTSNQNGDKIFTIDFFLIFGALLFSALVMYAVLSLEYTSLEGFVQEYTLQMHLREGIGRN